MVKEEEKKVKPHKKRKQEKENEQILKDHNFTQ